MTLAELNARDRDGFVAAVGWVFEHSPWIAERAFAAAPFSSLEALHAAMTAAAMQASRDEQLDLLLAHPDLGTRARMTTASEGEQAGAGLDRMERADYDRLQQLNTAYRARFGFPFLYAVKGSAVAQILAALEARSAASWDDEFAEGLRQASRIARFRLESVLSDGDASPSGSSVSVRF